MNKRQKELIKLNKNLLKLLASEPKTISHHQHIQHKAKKRPRNYLLIASLIVCVLSFSVVLGVGSAVMSRFALIDAFLSMMSTSPFIGEVNMLVIGLDNVEGSHRSDSIMVVHISPEQKKVSVVAIPRDTIMRVPGIGLTKINHAFAYGGVGLSQRTLENFLGMKIPFTVVINLDGLAKIIDTLGGLTINVEKRMYYVDYAGGLFVDLYPGLQRLNGRQAVGYVRFRHDAEGDIGRILRQQKFMQALASRIIAKKNVLSAPKVIMSLLSNVNTNMSTRQILGLALSMRQSFDMGKIEMVSLPGDPIMIDKVFYIKPNIAETERITQKYLMPNKKMLRNWGNLNS
jgi:LCP family protein required for cell wall assembly